MRQVHRVAGLRQRGLGVVRLWGSPEGLYLVCDLDGAPWLIACPAGMAGSSGRSTLGERGAIVDGALRSLQPRTAHPTRYPSAAKSARIAPKNRPSSTESSPGTFSSTNHRGEVAPRSRHTSGQRFRSSRLPCCKFCHETGGIFLIILWISGL
jgi:hypothetical protein